MDNSASRLGKLLKGNIPSLFKDGIENSIIKINSDGVRPPSKYYKPSKINCARQIVYELTDAPKLPENKAANFWSICGCGTDAHIRLQKAIEAMEGWEYVDVAKYIEEKGLTYLTVISKVGMETKLFDTRYNISFMCDGILKFRGEYFIFEAKTEKYSKWVTHSSVKEEHVKQGSTYSLCFDINKVLFLYECRDDCRLKAYMLFVTPEMKTAVVQTIQTCDRCIEFGTIPPIPTDVPKDICRWCLYRDLCKQNG